MFASEQTSLIVGFSMEIWHSSTEKLLPYADDFRCVVCPCLPCTKVWFTEILEYRHYMFVTSSVDDMLQLARLGWIMKVLINKSLGQRSSDL